MFKIGDKVVYPMHGAGVIESIEEREVLGEIRQYYIMKLPLGDMKIMVPINNVVDIGLRQVIDENGVQEVLKILNGKEITSCTNWNHRYRLHMEKIKSGNVYEIAEVIKNLFLRERKSGLSTGEKKMLVNAKQILISELVLSKGIEEDKAISMIDLAFA
jgi:CarD family transcriptional regulator